MDTDIYDGSRLLAEASRKHKINLSLLVAETALWANPEVHKQLLKDNKSGAWYPKRRRARANKGEKKGEEVRGIKLDDNTYANYAIKRAIGIPRNKLIKLATCHIWPDTCYNEKYHTAIPNLVLLPASLQSLTDYNPEIQAVLQYRAFELYKWVPDGKQRPRKPRYYPDCWKRPFDFTAKIEKAIKNRRQ